MCRVQYLHLVWIWDGRGGRGHLPDAARFSPAGRTGIRGDESSRFKVCFHRASCDGIETAPRRYSFSGRVRFRCNFRGSAPQLVLVRPRGFWGKTCRVALLHTDADCRLAAALYYGFVTGELEQAIQVYELWAKSYPQDLVPPANLGDIYRMLGQYEKAEAETQEALRLEPNLGLGYTNLAEIYLALNRPDDAKKAIEQGHEHKLDSQYSHWTIYLMAFLKGDAPEMERQVAWGAGKQTSCSRSNPAPRHTTDGY
jgi:Tetratricopeptide repeat